MHVGEAKIVFFAGKRGTGKTTLMKTVVRENLAARKDVRFVVWDKTTEWQSSPRVLVLHAWKGFTANDAAEISLGMRDVTLCVDEADTPWPNVTPTLLTLPGDCSAIHEIVNMGRHHRVGLFVAARRPRRLHIEIRANADIMYLFRSREPRDLAWIKDLAGEDWSTVVQGLEKRQWIRGDF